MSTFIGKGVVLCCLIQDLHEDWRAQWSVAQPLGDKPDRDVGHGKARVSKIQAHRRFTAIGARSERIWTVGL